MQDYPDWEHEVIILDTNFDKIRHQLREMSASGWELVCVTHHPTTTLPPDSTSTFAYFKRPKEM